MMFKEAPDFLPLKLCNSFWQLSIWRSYSSHSISSQSPFGFTVFLPTHFISGVTWYFGSLRLVLSYFQLWLTFSLSKFSFFGPLNFHQSLIYYLQIIYVIFLSGHLVWVISHEPWFRSNSVNIGFHYHSPHPHTVKINK